MPTDQWVMDNRNVVVKCIAYLRAAAALFFILGDKRAAGILIFVAIARLLFYFNPFIEKKKEVKEEEFQASQNPMEDGPLINTKKEVVTYF
jgi:hypothetical protein